MVDPPTQSPTVSAKPTALQGRPPEEAVEAIEEKVKQSKARLSELLFMSQHPSGEMWPSYLYTWRGFQLALKKMTTGVGPGEKNFFYIGDGFSDNSLEYGLVNVAAFIAHGISQAIYYDACDENSWDMVDFRYPLSNSCGQNGDSYQDEVCEREEDVGLECEVDPKMEIQGVTHARWVGAPPPMSCGDRSVGFWDHITGLEDNGIPFQNRAGRSDIKGCCWWGRGGEFMNLSCEACMRKFYAIDSFGGTFVTPFFHAVLQVRGLCSYGKINHWLGAKAAMEGRPSLYPDIGEKCFNAMHVEYSTSF